jgi:alanine dehydrogenase
MIIGVPKEIKDQEYRVALLPSAAYQLIKRGHQVLVERNAGAGAGYPDADYAQAGATMVTDHAAAFDDANLVVKVKEPLPSEYALLRPGQILFTYLHLAASRSLTEALMKSRITGLAYETIEVNRRLPLLEPMSEIAGRMSILVGGYFLAKHNGGSGVLLGGVPGVVAGQGRRAGRRRFGHQRRAHGPGHGRGCDHPGSGPGTNAVPGHHAAHGPHALLERSASAGAAAGGGFACRRGAGAGSQSAG